MSSFRVHDEKASPAIYRMKWNPRIDLIALVYQTDEIALHRLVEWQKVWSLSLGVKSNASSSKSSPSSNSVIDIEWRPDGKILAVGYTRNILSTVVPDEEDEGHKQSSIALIEIETAQVVHVIQPAVGFIISCLSWSSYQKVSTGDAAENENKSLNHLQDYFMYSDKLKKKVLHPLQPLTKTTSIGSKAFGISVNGNNSSVNGAVPLRRITDETLEDLMLVSSTTNPNVLCVGTTCGKVLMYSLGLLKIAELDVVSGSGITSVHLADTMGRLTVVHQEGVSTHAVPRIENNCNQILAVSLIHAQILTLCRYIKDAVSSLKEIWEEIMIDMETKLSFYFKKEEEGRDTDTKSYPTSDELMMLLVFGIPSASLEKFLKDMGEKGLRKLGHSIEATYTNLQKIVIMNLEKVCYHLHFHMNLLKGMSLWKQEFGELGLETEAVLTALKSIGSFLIKAVEFQQVIDVSVRNVKVFFRWLYTVIHRLYGPPTAGGEGTNASAVNEIIRISQQDTQTVREFIEQNFYQEESNDNGQEIKIKTEEKKKLSTNKELEGIFTLDHVGQYLRNASLTKLPLEKKDPLTGQIIHNRTDWAQFLKDLDEEGKQLLMSLGSPYAIGIYPHDESSSLIQEQKKLMDSLTKAFDNIQDSLSQKEDLYSVSIPIPSLENKNCILSTHVTNVNEECCISSLAPLYSPEGTEDSLVQTVGVPSFSSYLMVMKQSLHQERTNVEVNFIRFIEGPTSPESEQTEEEIDTKNILYIIQVDFYDTDHLFVLMRDVQGNTFIARIPVFILLEGSFPDVTDKDAKSNSSLKIPPSSFATVYLSSDSSTLSGIHYRKICTPGQKWSKMSVSGARRVACISSLRKIKVFETDIGEGEDEDEEDPEEAVGNGMDTSAPSVTE